MQGTSPPSHFAGQGTEAQGEKVTGQVHTTELDPNTGHLAPSHPTGPRPTHTAPRSQQVTKAPTLGAEDGLFSHPLGAA